MKFITAGIPRTAVAVAVGMLISSVAYAQSAEGSIYGRATPGDKITIENVEMGTSRQITVDATGAFTASKLQPGSYRVTANGVTRDVTVAIGSGTAVSFAADSMARVVVSSTRSTIDVSSVETNTVFTASQIQALPVSRDVNAVAVLAPGVVKGDPNLGGGNLPAFAGASVAENGYYINGFDVTNIRNFLSYANLPFDAIAQQQVKSGGYGAEYGRSLGGVISLVTKRGTNEWKGGGAVYYTPPGLTEKRQNVVDLNGDNVYTVYQSENTRRSTSYNVYAGGPIIKDKLFIFGLVEGKANRSDSFGSDSSTHAESTQPNGMVKIDFTPNDTHRFEFTGITNKRKTDVTDYRTDPVTDYPTSHLGAPRESTIKGGGHTMIAKYTGYLTDDFTLSVLAGESLEKLDKASGARVQGQNCPVVLDKNFQFMGCWSGVFPALARDADAPDDQDKRTAFRIDADYVIGTHTVRGGIDSQTFNSAQAGEAHSGGYYYLYRVANANGDINGVAGATSPNGQYVRRRNYRTTSGEFEVKNEAYYIEDSWKVTPNVMLYGGLRWESFDNMNADGVSFVKADNLMAPRLGFAWDVKGDASLKLYGNAGRYYIPVASNTNIRATRGELFEHTYHTFTSIDPVTAEPLGLSQGIGSPQVIGDGSLPNPATIADMNLKPMSQDEYILGFQQALANSWTFGVRGIARKVQNGMDDFCSHMGIEKWAADNGYANFDWHTLAGCMMVNPGNDVTLMIDVNDDGNLSQHTIPASYLGLDKYSRTYRALEFTLERPFDGTWSFNGSYVLSKSTGTAEGYVNSIINQEDAGVSQDFDFASLTHGSDGYLSNDRRHVFKAYGNYMLAENLRLGLNATVSSGRPISCIGYVPYTAADYQDAKNYTTASSFYCLNDQGQSELHQRGTFGRTPWTSSLDLSLAYMPEIGNGKLTLQLDVFNVFNQDGVTEVNERRDYSRADMPTSPTMAGRLNANWKQPTSFQEPRSVRMTARYEF